MEYKISTAFLLLLLCAQIQAQKFLSTKPAVLMSCSLKDAKFNACLARNFQVLFKEWANGVPELKSVGALDPFFVKRIKFAHNANENFKLQAQLDNVEIRGAGEGIVEDASFNIANWVSGLKVRAPKMNFNSDYMALGNVLGFNINGKGKAFFGTENIVIQVKLELTPRQESGHYFTDIKSIKAQIRSVDNFHMQLDNLFGGQKELEDTVNGLLNQNWRSLYDILKPVVEQVIEGILFDRLKKIFHHVPADYFIYDITA